MSVDKGLYHKYLVKRNDGKPLKGGFAVVLEVGDPLTHEAILAFAYSVSKAGYHALAADLNTLVSEERRKNEDQ